MTCLSAGLSSSTYIGAPVGDDEQPEPLSLTDCVAVDAVVPSEHVTALVSDDPCRGRL